MPSRFAIFKRRDSDMQQSQTPTTTPNPTGGDKEGGLELDSLKKKFSKNWGMGK